MPDWIIQSHKQLKHCLDTLISVWVETSLMPRKAVIQEITRILDQDIRTTPPPIERLIQPSRARRFVRINDRVFASLCWLGFQGFDLGEEWLNDMMNSVDTSLERPLCHPDNRVMLRRILVNASAYGEPVSEAKIDEVLAAMFGGADFEVIEVYIDSKDDLKVTLSGYAKQPITFFVHNTTANTIYGSMGRTLLHNITHTYTPIVTVGSPNTWYYVEFWTDNEHYGGRIEFKTNEKSPFWCRHLEVKTLGHKFKRTIYPSSENDLPPLPLPNT